MRKGENVFKRKDGRWEARYIKGREPSGRIRYGFCYGKTCGEAREKAMKCKAALLDNKPLPTSGARRRFAYYCDEWLQAREPVFARHPSYKFLLFYHNITTSF